MARNNIKRLRKAHGLTAEQLAERVGVAQGTITRIENGQRGLSVPLAERIAMALKEPVTEVLGVSVAPPDGGSRQVFSGGVAEDATPYTQLPEERRAFAVKPRANVDPWRVQTDALDQMAIHPGDVIFVDISQEAVENVRPLQAVIAQVYDPNGPLAARTVLRQFVPPSLLITNSSNDNAVPLNMNCEDVHIKGVVVDLLRNMTR